MNVAKLQRGAAPASVSAGFCGCLVRAIEPAENRVSWHVGPSETELEMVERHVREGELRVSRQREIVRELFDRNHPTSLAEQLLVEFEQTLADHKAHLARLNPSPR